MKRIFRTLIFLSMCLCCTVTAFAGAQDKYALPETYLKLEEAYLKEFPDLQTVMDMMINDTAAQLKNPTQDIMHNRICTSIVYQMCIANKQSKKLTRLAIAGDLFHNICKADKTAVLTDKNYLQRADVMIKTLRKDGFLKQSPQFWTNTSIFSNPKIGNNLGLIHHITGAVVTGDLLKQAGFKAKDIAMLQACIVEHSTGYWYFRSSINDVTGTKDGWKLVYPAPENNLAKYIHDADLISQFVPASVIPDGSKWRNLAAKRWGAKNTQEQGHIVYYVFMRMFEEAKTPLGKTLAKEKWDQIAPQLVTLMGLKAGEDPIKVLGVPKVFQGQ